jgi:glutathione peroxidase
MKRRILGVAVAGAALLAAVIASDAFAAGPGGDAGVVASRPTSDKAAPASALGFTVKDIAGEEVDLARKYRGKVVLIVNVASRCGYTKQYGGLETLHEKYAAKGLAVLGFPCNQFGGQEPGANAEIREFCRTRFGVEFDLFDKIDVNGQAASPLYQRLTGDQVPFADKGPVKWNFEKFLVGRDGQLIARYRSKVTPEQLVGDIETALAATPAP